ncbi:hypothetical protein AB3M93_15915 [Novosphingobium panipatense]|uniref:hypothetical protein n=1 Tax=Novosphingobium TaxID=165696 RepID=UPI000CDA146B|nr:hypothetical protein [Novosphingobium sp. HII-3]
MVRPTPHFPAILRGWARASATPVLFSHSELSGLSLFVEPHYHGMIAAETALAHLRHAHMTARPRHAS